MRVKPLLWGAGISFLGSYLALFLLGIFISIVGLDTRPGPAMTAGIAIGGALPRVLGGFVSGWIGRRRRPFAVADGVLGCLAGFLAFMLAAMVITQATSAEGTAVPGRELLGFLVWGGEGGLGAVIALAVAAAGRRSRGAHAA